MENSNDFYHYPLGNVNYTQRIHQFSSKKISPPVSVAIGFRPSLNVQVPVKKRSIDLFAELDFQFEKRPISPVQFSIFHHKSNFDHVERLCPGLPRNLLESIKLEELKRRKEEILNGNGSDEEEKEFVYRSDCISPIGDFFSKVGSVEEELTDDSSHEEEEPTIKQKVKNQIQREKSTSNEIANLLEISNSVRNGYMKYILPTTNNENTSVDSSSTGKEYLEVKKPVKRNKKKRKRITTGKKVEPKINHRRKKRKFQRTKKNEEEDEEFKLPNGSEEEEDLKEEEEMFQFVHEEKMIKENSPKTKKKEKKMKKPKKKSKKKKKKNFTRSGTSLPKKSTDPLEDWLINNILRPFPTKEEKEILCEESGLTMKQLGYWCSNVRKRKWGPLYKHLIKDENKYDSIDIDHLRKTSIGDKIYRALKKKAKNKNRDEDEGSSAEDEPNNEEDNDYEDEESDEEEVVVKKRRMRKKKKRK